MTMGLVSWKGENQFQVEISKTKGGGGGMVLTQGLARAFCCSCTQGLWCDSAGLAETWAGYVLGVQSLH